jgi:hypothetical protein
MNHHIAAGMTLARQKEVLFHIAGLQALLRRRGYFTLFTVQHAHLATTALTGKLQLHALAQKSLQQCFVISTLVLLISEADIVCIVHGLFHEIIICYHSVLLHNRECAHKFLLE